MFGKTLKLTSPTVLIVALFLTFHEKNYKINNEGIAQSRMERNQLKHWAF